MYPKIKLLIVGGCFPFQDNIEPEKLYHRILKSKLLEYGKINVEINLIRYDNIKSCFNKIFETVLTEKPDWLLFHMRVEPILLSSKFYCKYRDREGNIVKRVNLSSFELSIRMKAQNKIENNSSNYTSRTDSFKHKPFRELNYLLGNLLGNWSRSMGDYLKLLSEVMQLCKTENIILITAGPVSRPYSYSENLLSKKLNNYTKSCFSDHNQIFLDLLGMKDNSGNFLFCEDLKRVNQTGHKRIASIIFDAIKLNILTS